ncbi:hypothetical protein KAX02_13585 [candidate division WOR-3 bacterium]|nr:hypothetical protein [candidate division WOR-3 bacterium]
MEIDYPKVQLEDKDKEDTIIIEEEQLIDKLSRVGIIERTESNLTGKSFFLPSVYDWIIVKDSVGILCLVPLRKYPSPFGN